MGIIKSELQSSKEVLLQNSLDNAKYEIKRLELIIEDMDIEKIKESFSERIRILHNDFEEKESESLIKDKRIKELESKLRTEYFDTKWDDLNNQLNNSKLIINALNDEIKKRDNEIKELEEEYSIFIQKYNEAIIKIDAKEIKINNSAKNLIKKEQNAIIINNENKRLKLKVNQLIDQNKELAQKNNDLKTKQPDSSDLLNNMFNQFFK